MRLQTEIGKLKAPVNALTFNQVSLHDKDSKVQELTGLPSYAKLIVVFSFISSFLKVKLCLSPFQQLLLTLMRLRMNLKDELEAHLFHVSTSTADRVFNTTLNVLHLRLCNIIRWPSREQILISLPMSYRKNFKNCTSIIGCFQIFIERPKEMRARAQTYSQYKHHNTVKYLISRTPQGVISFVLKGWGGRTSDKYVTEHSGFLYMLSPGEVVLADRGFNVADSLGLVNAQLKIPAFTKGKQLLHSEEIESSRGLAAVRIHVERIIGLVRNKYTILQGTIPISLCYSAPDGLTPLDKMVRVCCALCNLCPPVVRLQ